MHVNNGSNSHQELKDFVYITCTTIQTLKNTKACLYGDTPRNSILREFSADGRFYCLWGHFVVSLRTADAFPVVASLPPKNREKRRPEMRLLFAGYLQVAKIQVAASNLLGRVGWGPDRPTSRCFNSTSHKFSIEAVFKASEPSFNGRRPSKRQGREVRIKSLNQPKNILGFSRAT